VIAFFSVARRRSREAILLILLAVVSAACGSSSSAASSQRPSTSTNATTADANGSVGPEGIPLERGPSLASASTTAPGTTVDGIQCAPVEQLAYHIHAHLQVYVNGQPRSLPGAIGLVGPVPQQTANGPFYGAVQCYYWLHTHASDGVVHIESPTERLYTLGDFFDEWRQPLSSNQVAGARGQVTAFINGQRWIKSPRALPLLPHAVIQLDVGAPTVPFGTISWAGVNL
jgi:hypothetical protein